MDLLYQFLLTSFQKEIIKDKAAGKQLDIPAPKYNSGGFHQFGK